MFLEQMPIPDSEDFLNMFWHEDGLPVFFAEKENVKEIVESLGFSIYYLFGNIITEEEREEVQYTSYGSNTSSYKKKVKVEVRTPQMFKVVNSVVSKAIIPVEEEFPLNSFKENALYCLPNIPMAMIGKLDEFFRTVDARYGTESIVLLTFDPTCEGSQGWGILVPDQVNNAVHCNYDPGSILEHKPETAFIVGSVHSHPGMPAYASGTDHEDQADFDGIHITFGWQKGVNNNATQYHIELQISGKVYTLEPDQVFETVAVVKEPDPEVIEWLGKVKKSQPPLQPGGHHSSQSHQSNQSHPGSQSQSKTNQTNNQGTTFTHHTGSNVPAEFSKVSKLSRYPNFKFKLGTDFIAENENIIVIAEISPNNIGEYICISCGSHLSHADFLDSECASCTIPVFLSDDVESDNLEYIASELAYWCLKYKYDLDAKVFTWKVRRDYKDHKNDLQSLKLVFTETLLEYLKKNDLQVSRNLNLLDEDDWEYTNHTIINIDKKNSDNIIEYEYSDELLQEKYLCCRKPVHGDDPCLCDVSVTIDDLLDFDIYTKTVNLYASAAACYSCQYFYEERCPMYIDTVKQFITDKNLPVQYYENIIDGYNCNAYTSDANKSVAYEFDENFT